MMMTPSEQLALFAELAEEAERAAGVQASERNPYALFNWSSSAKRHFMRALIGWRTALVHPEPEFVAAVKASEAALEFMRSTDVGLSRYMFEPVPGAYSAILTSQPGSAAVDEAKRYLSGNGGTKVSPDAVAESWLVSALTGSASGLGPEIAATLARTKKSALWGETLQVYFQLVDVAESDAPTAWALTSRATELFAERRRSSYVAAGPEYLGGDLDNEVVVDFHLAAIWHVRRWETSGLTDLDRLHIIPPKLS